MFKFPRQFNIKHSVLSSKALVMKKSGIHPVREWLSGLAVCTLMVAVGGVYATSQFLEYKNINTNNGSFTDKVPTYSSDAVMQALEIFKKRKETYEALQKTTPIAVQAVAPVVATSSVATEVSTTSVDVFE